ncbi:MAG TPA: S9 family peptidase [Thermomicrobiales bacterium]|jgi:dipeptidyl aminopeptidase/acylaminoacyl peptidase
MRYTFEQFAAARNYGELSFSPDGASLAYTTNTSGQFNVWRQPVATGPGGHPLMPVQLTALSDDAARRAIWSPDGARLLTAADRHGTENFQLYEIPAGEGWLYPLTDQPEVRHELGAEPFSPDGTQIAYASNERERGDFDVFVRDLTSAEGRPLLADGEYYHPVSWSPDGRSLLVAKAISNTDNDLYLLDVASGERRHLTPHDDEVQFSPGPWSPDGRGFYLLSDQGREFLGLAFYTLATGAIAWIETPEWDVQDVALTRDGRWLAWVVNEGGWSRLWVRDLAAGAGVAPQEFPALPRGVIGTITFSPTAPMLALSLTRPVRPATIYLLDIASGEATALTQSFLGGVPEAAMVEPETIAFTSADGRQIPAFLYRPHDIPAGGRVPVVLSIHGGPEAQERPGYAYNGLYQYLLNRGIGVLATNICGSTGYGKTYQKLIHRDWGGAELRDLESAAVYMRGLDWADPQRLGVFGGSFGGFATLSCVARLPEYWAAAVDIVGPSNLQTFVRAVPPAWKRMMKAWVGDPDEDAAMLAERSPITYVEAIRAPLLVIQGANDPRVVKPESDQMVERLRALDRTVEYMVFEDEGHGFTKTANALTALKATAEWFEKYLRS